MSFNQPQRLRKYAFKTPSLYISIPILILFLFILYLSSHSVELVEIFGMTLFFIILFDYSIQSLVGFTFHLRRIMLLLIISLLSSFIYYFIILLFKFLNPSTAFMLSLTPITFVRTMVYLTFTGRKRLLSHSISMGFPIILSIFFGILLPKFSIFIIAFLLSSIIYSIAADVFVSRSFSPFIKEFSMDPAKIISDIVNASYRGESYNEILGNFFGNVYNTFSFRPISILRFQNSKKFDFVFPYVHPGPLGEMGSSNITGKFSVYVPNTEMVIFHTSTTHDDNCSGDEDVKRLSQIFNEKALYEYEYCYRPYFGEFTVFLPIGEGGILFIIPDKVRFDDILLSEGKKLVTYARSLGLKWLDVVDAHNNNMDIPHELTDVSFIYEELKNGINNRDGIFPIYADMSTINYTSDDIGPGGVKLIKLKLGESTVGIMVFDGNNMDYNFRIKLESMVRGVDKLIVCTTDNHVVNMHGLSVNPVGKNHSHDELLMQIKDAFSNLEPTHRMKVEYIRKEYRVKIAGESHYEKLNVAIKKSLNSAKIYVVLMIIFSLVFSLFIFKYLS